MDKGIYDSEEEAMFNEWVKEAQAHGLVSDVVYQPLPYLLTEAVKIDVEIQLKTKIKKAQRALFAKHVYTPDFNVKLTEVGLRLFKGVFAKTYLSEPLNPLFCDHDIVAIDIKGGFANHDGGRSFSINQKLVWEKYHVYIERVVPWQAKGNCLFKSTFVPESLRWLSNRKVATLNTKGIACNTIWEFLAFSEEKENKKQMEMI